MTSEMIKDAYFRPIGYIDTYDNGDKAARDIPSQKILGFYRKSMNKTTDFYGRWIAEGDVVVSLLFNKELYLY